MPTYDYIIVGSGIAGLYAALLAKDVGTVLLLTKGSIEEHSARYAQGVTSASLIGARLAAAAWGGLRVPHSRLSSATALACHPASCEDHLERVGLWLPVVGVPEYIAEPVSV